jgi:hypothetical protein
MISGRRLKTDLQIAERRRRSARLVPEAVSPPESAVHCADRTCSSGFWGMPRSLEIGQASLIFAKSTLRFVIHVSGPDNALRATVDSPDQSTAGGGVDSITLSGSTLSFAIQQLDMKFSEDVNSNGTIVGALVQRGTGVPLILTRDTFLNPSSACPGPDFEPPAPGYRRCLPPRPVGYRLNLT